MERRVSYYTTVILEEKIHSWWIKPKILLCEFKFVILSKKMLMEHDIVEVIDHFIQDIQFS